MEQDTGGQGDLTRSDLALIRQALRQDWPIPPNVKAGILQRLIDYLDRETDEGATCSDRQVIMAARTLVEFCKLGIEQQKIDLVERRIDGSGTAVNLEMIALEMKAKRDRIDSEHTG